jgi:RNA polymerase sigma-70 factor (ECF subfamily)
MSEEDQFLSLVRRLRAGDGHAAAELMREYEPIVRRAIRFRLTDARLCRVLDSMDICQSVMGSFFVHAACGGYELQDPRQLIKLLTDMARNKLVSAGRKAWAKRRDIRRVVPTGVEDVNPADDGATPSRIVAGEELLEKAREQLTQEERQLAERRAQGQEWAEIAAELGGTANGRRVQLARALGRVADELGLND